MGVSTAAPGAYPGCPGPWLQGSSEWLPWRNGCSWLWNPNLKGTRRWQLMMGYSNRWVLWRGSDIRLAMGFHCRLTARKISRPSDHSLFQDLNTGGRGLHPRWGPLRRRSISWLDQSISWVDWGVVGQGRVALGELELAWLCLFSAGKFQWNQSWWLGAPVTGVLVSSQGSLVKKSLSVAHDLVQS